MNEAGAWRVSLQKSIINLTEFAILIDYDSESRAGKIFGQLRTQG